MNGLSVVARKLLMNIVMHGGNEPIPVTDAARELVDKGCIARSVLPLSVLDPNATEWWVEVTERGYAMIERHYSVPPEERIPDAC